MSFVLVRAGQPTCTIRVPPDASAPVRFAAQELQRYVQAISGARLACVGEDGDDPTGPDAAVVLRVSRDASGNLPTDPGLSYRADDTFRVSTCGRDLVLTGHSDRAVLYAVYWLLEQLGVRFVEPGDEYVPQCETLEIDGHEHHESPAFPVRSMCVDLGQLCYRLNDRLEGTDFTHVAFWTRAYADKVPPELRAAARRELLRQIDWMGKHRLNGFLPAHFVGWEADAAEVVAAMDQRGIMLEAVGHGLPALLPRDLFDMRPELFRMQDGQRRRDGNFCTSHPDTLRTLADNALALVRLHPTIRVLQLWADDVTGGSWCECERCRDLSAYEQAMRAINAVADAVADQRPDVLVSFAAYHDTLLPQGDTRPHDNVSMMYAPRERCYAHSLADGAACARNRQFAEQFLHAKQPFGDRVAAFEYYCDNILFHNHPVPLLDVISRDLAFYRQAGVSMAMALCFLDSAWWAYPLNYLVFARCAWDLDTDVDALVRDYCAHRYGSADAAELYRELERVMADRVALCPYDVDEHPNVGCHHPPSSSAADRDAFVARVDRATAALRTLADRFAALPRWPERERSSLECTIRMCDRFRPLADEQQARERGDADAQAHAHAARRAVERDLQTWLRALPNALKGSWVDEWVRVVYHD